MLEVPARMRFVPRVGLVTAVILVVSLGVLQAAVAATWSIQSTPNPTGATHTDLSAVACAASNACTAVGHYVNSTGTEVTLAEAWNGTSWSVETTPNPTGARRSALNGVSCTSSTACTAVGFIVSSAGTAVTLAEVWNGSGWAIEGTPNPTGATDSELEAVSCMSSTACISVGSFVNITGTPVTLAEGWNGADWAIQSTPNPTGATSSVLHGVSCPSASACTAVGATIIGAAGSLAPLAEGWNGTTWSLQSSPSPAGASASEFSGVSCTTPTACTAVGNYVNSTGIEVTLAERWNGTGWTLQGTPSPASAAVSALNDVSCMGSNLCTAVGFFSSAAASSTLAERWNGTSWSIQATPNPTGPNSALDGVSCTAARACTAVGFFTNSAGTHLTLAEVFAPSWQLQSSPNPTGATNSVLDAVSCSSATDCMAVGASFYRFLGDATLAERWNGTSWSLSGTPNLSGATDNFLDGVSCTSSTACTAVGHAGTSGTDLTLVERWNGTSWAIQTTPDPSGATASELDGVSCISSTACTAVGFSSAGAGDVTLAETWNGTSWSIPTTPNPSGATNSDLFAVSCTSASACTAVGYANGAGVSTTLGERWNGTSWSIQSTPNPTGATYSFLSGVSCPSATDCTAVGFYVNSTGTQETLAERWNGTTWSIQTTPNPSGALSSGLNGVSCASSATCTAVGTFFENVGMGRTLAERWNGQSWAVQNTKDPTSAQQSFLNGVSCTSASVCTAVGTYETTTGTSLTLVERFS